jgi:hypothetical protein
MRYHPSIAGTPALARIARGNRKFFEMQVVNILGRSSVKLNVNALPGYSSSL